MSLHYALVSDRGRVREDNEDFAAAETELGLFVVADGMGGHLGGEVASRVAVKSFIDAVRGQTRPRLVRDEARVLHAATLAANLAVVDEAERRLLQGMGTTLTALRMRGATATIANVGDSRATAITNTGIRPLTRDDTVVATLVADGSIEPHEAMTHPDRHILTQAIGTRDAVEPEITRTRIGRGTRVLLSSDGLHDVVPPGEIAVLGRAGTLEESVQALVDRANELGGPDNVTALLIET